MACLAVSPIVYDTPRQTPRKATPTCISAALFLWECRALSAAVALWCLVVKQRAGLLLSGTVLASVFVTAPAFAQDAQTDQMQRQINALQKQLQTLQSQVTETKQQAKAAQ